jgi:transposase-like protein
VFRRIPKEVKDKILNEIKLGGKVVAVAQQYGISEKTIYGWLREDTNRSDGDVSWSKYQRLKKENDELKKLIGDITWQLSREKKVELIKGGSSKAIRARALGIDPKNIYYTSKLRPKDKLLKKQIKSVHQNHPAYGHRRVALSLGLDKKKVSRVMKKFSLTPPRRHSQTFSCTVPVSHCHLTNLVKNITPQFVGQIWSSDTSCIKYHYQKIYLSTIKDNFSRAIVGANISKYHDST